MMANSKNLIVGVLVTVLGFQTVVVAEGDIEVWGAFDLPNTFEACVPDQPMYPSFNVKNVGDETVSGMHSTMYFSEDTVISSDDTLLWYGYWIKDSFDPNEEFLVGWPPDEMPNPIMCPVNYTEGIYYIIHEVFSDTLPDSDIVYSQVTLTGPVPLPSKSINPSPINGATNQSRNVVISWENGGCTESYRVYFGTDPTPDSSEFRGIQTSTNYYLSLLNYKTTYYWRIDATNSSGTITGDVWRFATDGDDGGGVRAEYFVGMAPQGTPCLTQIEPNIDYDWGDGEVACGRSDQVSARWTADLHISVSDTYTFYTTSDDGVRLYLDGERILDHWTSHASEEDQSPAQELVAGQVYSLVMEYYENTGDAIAQLYWETPTMEREIIPPGPLQPSQPSGEVPAGVGTGIPFEGFEHFTDNVAAGEAIFQTWIGGSRPEYPGNGTGATVGHPEPPYAEQTIVFSGDQSMPLYYDNSRPPFYSQADRTWETPQVWGGGDAQALVLAVHGRPSNDLAQLYVLIEDTGTNAGVQFHPDPDILIRDEWSQWVVPLQIFRDQGVNVGAVKKMSIGMGDPANRTRPNDLKFYADSDSRAYFDDFGTFFKLLCVTVSCDDPLHEVHRATLTFTPHGGSGDKPFDTDDKGYGEIWLAPAAHDINVKAEGFEEKDIIGWNGWQSGSCTNLLIKLTVANNRREYPYSDESISIPDDDWIWFYLDIEDGGTIADLDVKLNVDHERGADLEVVLFGPDSTSIKLSDDDSSWTDGFLTIFDDEAPSNTPRHRKPLESLSAFDGKSITGTWKLRIWDTWPDDVGKLRSWSLSFEMK